MSYKSGFCAIGAHEGTVPVNVNGRALPTCTLLASCGCDCHDIFNEMYQQTGHARAAVNLSNYSPDKGDFIMPDMAELAASRASASNTPAMPVNRIESPDPTAAPAIIRRTYAPTVSGILAKGELEDKVNDVCTFWALCEVKPTENCTPGWVSQIIADKYAMKNPSVGAIGAVFDRWVKIGYAQCDKKPVRFTCYTQDGLKLGLPGCRERFRRTNRR